MGKIFCLIGKSGTGKSEIFLELMKSEELMLKPIIAYTTRPKRTNEIHARDYYFIDNNLSSELLKSNIVIFEQHFETNSGFWSYWFVDNGKIELENNYYLIILPLQAYKKFAEYFGYEKVVSFYINVEDEVRKERVALRETNESKPNSKELERRFELDNIDFSNDNLCDFNADFCIENKILSNCINEIKSKIKSYY